MNHYYVELTKKGIKIFKGGNIEVMIKPLIHFEAENIKHAEKVLYDTLNKTIGTASANLYKLREVSQ